MIPLQEVFISVQGEGPLQGRPTLFVRLHGCHYGCHECDTGYADPAQHPLVVGDWEQVEDHWRDVAKQWPVPLDVCLTGGEPFEGPWAQVVGRMYALIAFQPREKLTVETNGAHLHDACSIKIDKILNSFDLIIVSPKLPSFRQPVANTLIRAFQLEKRDNVILKFAVGDEDDFTYLKKFARNRTELKKEAWFIPTWERWSLADLVENFYKMGMGESFPNPRFGLQTQKYAGLP